MKTILVIIALLLCSVVGCGCSSTGATGFVVWDAETDEVAAPMLFDSKVEAQGWIDWQEDERLRLNKEADTESLRDWESREGRDWDSVEESSSNGVTISVQQVRASAYYFKRDYAIYRYENGTRQ